MLNDKKKISLLFTSLLILNAQSYAANNDYDADYYEDEGRLVFKVRAFGAITSPKQKGLPAVASRVNSPADVGKFVANGFGGDASTTIFFSDNIAGEMALGFGALRTKNLSLRAISHNYGNDAEPGKRKDVYIVPLTLTAQYHIAPFGTIRPYIGGGYHGAYIFSKSKAFKIKNGHGVVGQVGVDLALKDDTLITFDVKQYLLNTKVTYKGGLVSNRSNISSKIKLNPILISAGIGFKF